MNGHDLSGLAVGDALVVRDSQGRYSHRTVAAVARVWLTDSIGDKFRVATGEGEQRHQVGYGYFAMTVAEWEAAEETAQLRQRLLAWGWAPRHRGQALTLGQLRRAAALIAEFEAEASGGLL